MRLEGEVAALARDEIGGATARASGGMAGARGSGGKKASDRKEGGTERKWEE